MVVCRSWYTTNKPFSFYYVKNTVFWIYYFLTTCLRPVQQHHGIPYLDTRAGVHKIVVPARQAMSVTANQLSKSGARGKDLDAVVREHIQIIDDKLLKADRTWGRNVVTHDLPIVLALPGLDKKDAQRIVYSTILRSLDRRGFETRILLEPDFTTVYIAWMTDLDIEEVEAMNSLIRAKRIQRDVLEDFVQRGSAPAPRSALAVRQGRANPAPPMTVADDGIMNPRGGMGTMLATETRATGSGISPAEVALLNSGNARY